MDGYHYIMDTHTRKEEDKKSLEGEETFFPSCVEYGFYQNPLLLILSHAEIRDYSGISSESYPNDEDMIKQPTVNEKYTKNPCFPPPHKARGGLLSIFSESI